MVKFKIALGKWLDVRGEGLKGRDLAITLLFLSFIVALLVVVIATIGLPKIQVLF